jgi:hypothetical protein
MLSREACPKGLMVGLSFGYEGVVGLHAIDGCVLDRWDLWWCSVKWSGVESGHAMSPHMKVKDALTLKRVIGQGKALGGRGAGAGAPRVLARAGQ